uniref:Uncharacterized protein n=1 Tax=Macaca fascicularis TaxID=9541 RepID=Q9GMW1_MACFA|nr:hypothetical protein [Macaca fascicularis]
MQIYIWTMYLILCKQITALFLIEVVQCSICPISGEWYLFRGLVLVLAVSCWAHRSCDRRISLNEGRSMLLSPYIVLIPTAMTTLYMSLLDKHWKRDWLTVIK